MADTGAKYPTSAATAVYGAIDWVDSGNIFADDGNDASAPLDTDDITYYLKAKGFDFSAIPGGSTILGVEFKAECYSNTNAVIEWNFAELLDTSANPTGDNKSTAATLTTVPAVTTLGGSADKWGCALTTTWVQNANFGAAIAFKSLADGKWVAVDYVTMTVYYTPPGGGAQVIAARPFTGPMIVRCS